MRNCNQHRFRQQRLSAQPQLYTGGAIPMKSMAENGILLAHTAELSPYGFEDLKKALSHLK